MQIPRPINSPAYRWLVKKSFAGRRLLGALIPDSAAARARSSLGLQPVRWIELNRLRLIREADQEHLRNAAFLERELLPQLGLSGDATEVYPPELVPYTAQALRHWQYPSQFSKYLAHLSKLQIETYLEIGVQYGGTFAITVEYLQRFCPLRRAFAVDVNRVPSLNEYAKQNPAVQVLREDTSTERFARFVERSGPFDLVLIDGDHSEEGCQRDFDAVRDHARHIAFHDIVDPAWPGVERVWSRVRQDPDYETAEFTDQYPDVQRRLGHSCLGIGFATRRGAVNASR
jgi:cephalosporin hydroxylase